MNKVLIIAEAGVNHNGSVEIAKRMIDTALEAGVDIIKFQTGLPKNVISRFAPKAEYQIENTGKSDDTQLEMANDFAMRYEDFAELKRYCEEVGIEFLSTPFDLESTDYLHEIGVKLWKIPSGEVTNLPYLRNIASFHEPVIMSTGMCTLEEVRDAVRILEENGAGDISLLHCTTDYPAAYEDVNLKAMLTLEKEFGVAVGYSDHTRGIEVPIAAVAMGATIIEKHFTLDRNMEGPDHKASLEPDELKAMVCAIRNVENSLGDGIKNPKESEIANITVARKSIVAKCPIKKGEIYTEENLTTKRPGNGISAMLWDDVLGKSAIRDFCEDELIEI
ncbi:MAG: N-acetylneuraminate synthase [Lachnospiraceae bacterium]|nr:N-acetylneuraminate synthase [Candidatus Colinaster scatohippi]